MRPYDVLNQAEKAVAAAESRWLAWAEECGRAYREAYKRHTGALTAVRESLRRQEEASWFVLNLVLSFVPGAAGAIPWVPRLLVRAQRMVSRVGNFSEWKGAVDDLTASWMGDALRDLTGDAVKSLQGTLVERIKSAAVGRTDDPFEAVVENSDDWGSRLRQGILVRAADLKESLLEVSDTADRWTLPAAEAFRARIETRLPFVAQQPRDIGPGHELAFQKSAEREMWIQWGLRRDKNYWFRSRQDERRTLPPVLLRLLALGVPAFDVASDEYIDGTPYQAQILSMNKYIAWAEREDRVAKVVRFVMQKGRTANDLFGVPATRCSVAL